MKNGGALALSETSYFSGVSPIDGQLFSEVTFSYRVERTSRFPLEQKVMSHETSLFLNDPVLHLIDLQPF